MEETAKVLDELGITYSVQVLSAHRMPIETMDLRNLPSLLGLK